MTAEEYAWREVVGSLDEPHSRTTCDHCFNPIYVHPRFQSWRHQHNESVFCLSDEDDSPVATPPATEFAEDGGDH